MSEIYFSVEINDNDLEFAQRKEDFLMDLGYHLSYQLILENGYYKLNPKAIEAIRISMLSDEEFYFLDGTKDTQLFGQFVSPINEFRTIKELKRKFNQLKQKIENDSPSIWKEVEQMILDLCKQFLLREKKETIIITESHVDERFAALFEWAKQNGVFIHPLLKPNNFEIGRGFFSSGGIQQDEVIIRLPRSLIFNIDAALRSELGELYKQLIDQGVHEDTILILYTIHEKHNPNSLWAPYFNILPTDVNIGLTLPLEELVELEGLPLMMDIIDAKEQLRVAYDGLFPSLSEQIPQAFPNDIYTFENFLWTRAIFESRAFSINMDGQKNCLLPFVDMLNTSNYPQLDSKMIFNQSNDEFQIITFGECKAGEQLFINYGPYSNRELFLNYGFMIHDNPYDRFRIRFEIPGDENETTKLQLLLEQNLSLEHFLRKGPLSLKIIGSLRICMMNSNEINAVGSDDYDPIHRKISDRNEKEVFTVFNALLDDLLSMFDNEEENNDDEDSSLVLQYQANQRDILLYTKEQLNKLT